jgi:hypothetical protein
MVVGHPRHVDSLCDEVLVGCSLQQRDELCLSAVKLPASATYQLLTSTAPGAALLSSIAVACLSYRIAAE